MDENAEKLREEKYTGGETADVEEVIEELAEDLEELEEQAEESADAAEVLAASAMSATDAELRKMFVALSGEVGRLAKHLEETSGTQLEYLRKVGYHK